MKTAIAHENKLTELIKTYPVTVLLSLGFVYGILCIIAVQPQTYPDTYDYIKSGIDIIRDQTINIRRTPIYPFIIDLIYWMFPEYIYLKILFALQYLLTLFVMPLFFRVARDLCGFWIGWTLTLFVILSPQTVNFASIALTESLTFSGMIVLVYFLWVITKEVTVRWTDVVWMSMTVCFLIFLKPQTLFIVPALMIFIVIMVYEHKYKKAYKVLTGLMCSGLIIISYCYVFYCQYGIFSLSLVGLCNQYDIMVQNNNLDLSGVKNKELRNIAENRMIQENSLNVCWNHLIDQIETYDLTDVDQMVKAAIKDNPWHYMDNIKERYCFQMKFESKNPWLKYGKEWQWPLPFMNLNGLVFITLFYGLIFAIRRGKGFVLPSFSVLLIILILGDLGTVLVGAPNDWTRLMIPSFVPFLLIVGSMLSLAFRSRPANNADVLDNVLRSN